MARDLIQTKALIGKEYWELTALLGDPDIQAGRNTVEYVLEEIPGADVAPDGVEYMRVILDAKGKVRKVDIDFR